MKKYFSLLLVIIGTHAFAQFKLSGNIAHYNGHGDLKVNIPLVYGFNEANSITIPIAKNGSFSINLPIKGERFADVIYQQNFHLILMTPGKNLKVELSQTDNSFKPVGGKANTENILLQTVNVEEYPFFLKNSDTYTSLSPADLDTKLVRPYLAVRDKKIAIVNQSTINPKDKKLIASELKYAVYNNLYELVMLGGPYADKLNKLVMAAFAKADAKPEASPAGPQYYLFANYYLWYKETKAAQTIKAQNLKPNQIIPEYGITVAEEGGFVSKYGDVYLRWLSATKFLSMPVVEQLGYMYFTRAIKVNNVALANVIAKEYLKKFPGGVYKKNIKTKLAELK